MHLKPSTQPPQAQSGQGQQELQVASGTASQEALGNVAGQCVRLEEGTAGFARARDACAWGCGGSPISP